MKQVLKYVVANTYKPWLSKYLSKTRIYRYEDIQLVIPPQVFHPGFFFSTRLLLDHIKKISLKKKKVLELGCGSGLIAIYAAKQKAEVTATDINKTAIEFLNKNKDYNNVELNIIESNLFEKIPSSLYDIVVINPPYYKKDPKAEIDYAWFCGENGEYFFNLFNGLNEYIHHDSKVVMILFDGCDMDMIKNFATANKFRLTCVETHKNILEKNFIYHIEKT